MGQEVKASALDCSISLLPALLECSFVYYLAADFNNNFWPLAKSCRKSLGCLGLGRGK
jgi:hypothetical protein